MKTLHRLLEFKSEYFSEILYQISENEKLSISLRETVSGIERWGRVYDG